VTPGGTTRLEVVLAQGVPGRLFHIQPRGAEGEDLPWPAGLVPTWENSVPGVASCVVAPDGRSAVLQPITGGATLITVRAATCISYISVTVNQPAIDHIDVLEPPA
jgi:hypothetical protein